MVREVMRLAFLLAREYWPYSKWFGTAFGRLPDPDGLGDTLARALAATASPDREDALGSAYETVAHRHNAAGLTTPVDPTARPYHGRPFRVIMADRFVAACRAAITDPWLLALPMVGSLDQFTDYRRALARPDVAARLRAIYQPTREG
jgi:hypothetical protein